MYIYIYIYVHTYIYIYIYCIHRPCRDEESGVDGGDQVTLGGGERGEHLIIIDIIEIILIITIIIIIIITIVIVIVIVIAIIIIISIITIIIINLVQPQVEALLRRRPRTGRGWTGWGWRILCLLIYLSV